MHKIITRLLILAVVLYQLLLAGCSITPTAPSQDTSLEQRLEELYRLAKNSDATKSEIYRIEAADLLSQQQRYSEAATILEGLTLANLPNRSRATYAIVTAELALSRFDGKAALSALNQHNELILQLDQDTQLRSSKLRARSFDLLERYLDSARERIHIAPLLNPEERAANETALWASLIKVPTAQLQEAANQSRISDEQGWLALALVAQANRDNLDKQLTALQRWQLRWPLHPAAANLPKELALLSQIITERPSNIVLMLPLQGRNALAGQAIRDGFLASYYAALNAGDKLPAVRIIDTTNIADFNQAYDDVAQQGADFIIGPLEKSHVQTLQSRRSLAIPTLALNYGLDNSNTEQLYQFGLSAEDEARQAAQKAWLSGYKTSLVLTPGSSWGQRIATAFNDEWQKLGGTVLENAFFDEETIYSKAIETLFDINSSKQRAKRVQAVIARNIEFTARRRQDVDFIFIAATPKQARQIKPTLAFHFAGNIPVYATSHIYAGGTSTLLDSDLDGITFTETPWMLGNRNDPVKRAVDSAWPATAERLGRLYALGVDAYQLYPRIQLLSGIGNNQLSGATGLLTLDKSGRVVRTLQWAEIMNGRIQALE